MKVYVCWTTWFTRDYETENDDPTSLNVSDDYVDLHCIFTDESRARQWEAIQNKKAWDKWFEDHESEVDGLRIKKSSEMHFAHVREYELDKWIDVEEV